MSQFAGRTALVTGAGSGIGRAMALELAKDGASVMCADIDEQGAQSTARQVEDLGANSGALGLDVADTEALRAALHKTADEMGGLHILMNNAGVGANRGWPTTIDINLSAVYHGMAIACPMMAASGGGAIVNTASIAGLNALVRPNSFADDPAMLESVSAYVGAKHGVVGITKQFAVAYASQGVRVNALCPGYIVTPMTAPAREREGGVEFLESLHPAGRLGEPEEVAAAAAFLASDAASFINGVALPVDGGYSAR